MENKLDILNIKKVDANTYYHLVDIYGKETVHQTFSEYINKIREQNDDSYEVQLQIWEKFGYYLALLDHNPFKNAILEKFMLFFKVNNYKHGRELLSFEEEIYYGFHLLKRDYIEVFLKENDFVSLDVGKIFRSIKSGEVFKEVLDKFEQFYQVCDRNSYFDQKFKKYLKECRNIYDDGKLPNVDIYSEFINQYSSKDSNILDERMLLDQLDMYIKSSIARIKFVTSNVRLVESYVNGVYRETSSIDKEEFIQEGFLGLTRSIDTFDIRFGNKFSTYAYGGIRNSVYRLLCNFSRTIRIPVYRHGLMSRLEKVKNIFYQRMGREPKFCELLEILNIDEETLISVIYDANMLNCQSLQFVIYERDHVEDDVLLEASVPDTSVDVEGQVLSQCIEQSLLNLMDKTLTEREKDVLFKRAGYLMDKAMTLQEIGDMLGCTRERVRQIEAEAIKKLTRTERGRSFNPYK